MRCVAGSFHSETPAFPSKTYTHSSKIHPSWLLRYNSKWNDQSIGDLWSFHQNLRPGLQISDNCYVLNNASQPHEKYLVKRHNSELSVFETDFQLYLTNSLLVSFIMPSCICSGPLRHPIFLHLPLRYMHPCITTVCHEAKSWTLNSNTLSEPGLFSILHSKCLSRFSRGTLPKCRRTFDRTWTKTSRLPSLKII